MSTQSQRVDTLIKEHSSLNTPEKASAAAASGANNGRVTAIRQELVQILQRPPAK